MSTLGEFDGVPVTGMAIAVRNAGDGLSEELDISPSPHETGSEVFLVLRGVTGPIDHEPLTDEGKKAKGRDLVDGFASYKRIEDLIVLQATEVDGGQVQEWLADAAARVQVAKAERKRIDDERKAAEREAAEREAGIVPLTDALEPDGA